MRILVVDDEPAILTSTALLLEGLGHEVIALRDHAASLDVLGTFHADVLLQDVRMPGLDLESHIKSVRDALGPDAPGIVLFSASVDLAETAAGLPAAAWLEKPFRPFDLAHALDEALAILGRHVPPPVGERLLERSTSV